MAQTVENMPSVQETLVQSLGQEDRLEKRLTTDSMREFHEQRSLAGYCPWGHKESDTTEQLSMHTHVHANQKSIGKRRGWITMRKVQCNYFSDSQH